MDANILGAGFVAISPIEIVTLTARRFPFPINQFYLRLHEKMNSFRFGAIHSYRLVDSSRSRLLYALKVLEHRIMKTIIHLRHQVKITRVYQQAYQ